MLGARNALYGLRMSELLQVRGLRRLGAAQLVIDESVAMAIGRGPRCGSPGWGSTRPGSACSRCGTSAR